MDMVFSHTCPLKYQPQDVFLDCVNQVVVDKSTAQWLDAIEGKLDYDRWYCGHYHVYKTIDKLRFLYNDFVELR